jgi:hypothetical protein
MIKKMKHNLIKSLPLAVALGQRAMLPLARANWTINIIDRMTPIPPRVW